MQQMSQQIRSGQRSNGSINLKVVIQKGIIWGIIGGIIGFLFSEFFTYGPMQEQVYDVIKNLFGSSDYAQILRIHSGIWTAVSASMIGLLLGIGEGVYYGSTDNALKYGIMGFGISLIIGFISGDVAQFIYANAIRSVYGNNFMHSFIRAIGWSIMGVGVGAAIGLIKFEAKRFLYCLIGGGIGAFIGGFMFDYIADIFPGGNGTVARFVGTVCTGLLIGAGVGLLEQFAKAAWLKIVRGEFEGKEFLVFNGLTSVGGTGKNSIVLFKDKLVAPHHFDINMEGNKYILTDCGSPMGTIVNGRRVDRYMLRDGDAISIGNTILVFNSK